MAFGGCLPRGAQSSYLTSDHHPVGTEPASGRGGGRALYRRHIVLDCLRCQWERGTALYSLPASASVGERDASYHQRPLPTRDWHLIGRIVVVRIS